MEGAGEIVFARGVIGEIQGPAHEQRQQRRHQGREHDVAPVAQLGEKGAAQKGAQLGPFVAPPDFRGHRGGGRRGGRGIGRGFAQVDQAHVLEQAEALVFVAPVVG